MTDVYTDFGTASNRNRKASLNSHYRTGCSICRLGIFFGQPVVWTRGKYLGFSHEKCAAELCTVCGEHVEGLARSGNTVCALCADDLTRERFGDVRELEKERFGTQRRAA